jgi:hypothetical protein
MLVRHRLAACAAGLICAGAVPAVADAATLTNAGGRLSFVSGPGTNTGVSFSGSSTPGDTTVLVSSTGGDPDPITQTGCTDNLDGTFTCAGVTELAVDAGDGDDSVTADDIHGRVLLTGGAGDDFLTISGSQSGAGTLIGGPGEDDLETEGPAADALDGGDGDDVLYVYLSATNTGGADVLTGGSGIDYASVGISLAAPAAAGPSDLALSLDGVANDGPGGANLAADIEDASGYSYFSPGGGGNTRYGRLTVIGNAGANSVGGDEGADAIDAGPGSDTLNGYGGDDTLNARDGYADRVFCGRGNDVAIVDTFDQVGADCESIQTADVGNALDDKPPTIAWTAPAAAAKLPGDTPTTLTVNAADDKGVTQVQFLDDDRVVCTDTAAPYTCAYQARGDDVGRNTLVAIASDAAGNTASSVRTVNVDRFSARSVSLTLKPAKDKRAPYRFKISGKVALPVTVASGTGCAGTVAVTVKAGRKTISTRTDELSKACAYTVTVSFSSRSRFPSNGKLKVQATFRGNEVLKARKSSTKTAGTK